MSRRKTLLVYELVFAVGLLILLYPVISNTWNTVKSKTAIRTYDTAVSEDNGDSNAKLIESAQAYNKGLTPKEIPDAFSIRENTEDEIYESLLNPTGGGVMGWVEIPVIDVNLPIGHYTTEDVLQEGCGHLFGSDLPVGGKGTHAVIVAHRGLPSAKLFSDLNLLKKGDRFFLHVAGEVLAYEVDDINVVLPVNTEALQRDPDKDLVTLLTCTPYGVNTHRLLVRGHRVKYDPSDAKASPRKDISRIIITILCVILGAVIAWMAVRLLDRRKDKDNTDKVHRKPKKRNNSGSE